MAYLSGWTADQRRELSIDSSKVDGALTDFPVKVNIPQSIRDVLESFTLTGDPFNGANDDPPNADLWTVTQNDGANVSIQSNKLNFTSPGGDVNEISKIDGIFNLQGDIDVQVDFDYSTLTAPTDAVSWAANVSLMRRSDNANVGNVAMGRDTSNILYASSGVNAAYTTYTTAHSSGKLRITRVSGVIKVYIWSGSQWEWNGSTAGRQVTNSETGDLYFRFWFEQENNSTVVSNADNFTINSGTVAWPQGTHPNRKKIAVTEDDELTECKVEIEVDLDVLWVKIPAVSASVDTVFYLYYDPDHAPNTANVGDTGDTPAQAVWDSDFVMVFHFEQDPSGGANSILDSTGNGYNMSPVGGMDDSNLVDGPIGKGLDFTPSEFLRNLSAFNPLNDNQFSLESLVKPHSFKSSANSAIVFNWGASSGFYLSFYNGYPRFYFTVDTSGSQTQWSSQKSANNTYYWAGTWLSGEKPNMFLDNATKQQGGIVRTGLLNRCGDDWNIGSMDDAAWSSGDDFDGHIYEVRVHKVKRSDAWMFATYYSLVDDLIDYGEVSSPAGIFGILQKSAIFGGLIVR